MIIQPKPRQVLPMLVASLFCSVAAVLAPAPAAAQETIEVSEVLVTVIQQVRVPALRAGSVTKLNVREGDYVDEGELLAQIDDREPRLAKLRAKSEYDAAIKAAESELAIRLAVKKNELARSDLRRVQGARAMLAGSVTDEEYENRKLQVESTALEIDKSKEERDNAIEKARLIANDYRNAELDMGVDAGRIADRRRRRVDRTQSGRVGQGR